MRIRNSLHRAQRNLEFAIAQCADSDGWNGPQPFGDPKVALPHSQDSQTISEAGKACDTRHTVGYEWEAEVRHAIAIYSMKKTSFIMANRSPG